MTTEGAITAHARFRLAQLETLASDAAAEAARFQAEYDASSERLVLGIDSYAKVQVAKENLDRAQAQRDGSKQIFERFAGKMKDPMFLAQLAEADAAKEKFESTNFAEAFDASLGPRIEAAAKALACLIPEAQALVGEHAKVCSEMILAVERVGMRELTAGTPIIDQSVGLGAYVNRMLVGFKASGVEWQLLRYLGMQR